MDIITQVYLPLLGLAVGSFLNLTIDRVPRGQSIVAPASRCDVCHRRLSPLDLVPVLSYIWLRGKCSGCGISIPARNPLVEIVTGVFFGTVHYLYGLDPVAWVILGYGSLFIAIAVIDLELTIIPDKLVLPGVVLAFAAAHFGPVGEERSLAGAFASTAAGGGLGLGLMLTIYLGSLAVYRHTGGFGFGDVKLGLLIGLVIGYPDVAVGFYFAFVLGGVVAVLLLLLKLRARKDTLPYGPFLVGGAMATLIVGEDLGWYLELLR